MSTGRLTEIVGALSPIGLEDLDAKASLQRRTDHKYLVPAGDLEDLVAALAADHLALEAAGTRTAGYDNVYFDTPGLRCYEDHVAGRDPRFKVRSRLYRETEVCAFEVKVKHDGETLKEHLQRDPADHGRLDGEARDFADEVLRRCTGGGLPEDFETSLITRFDRATLVAADGHERVTIDAGLRLEHPGGACAALRSGCMLVECKSDGGDGRCDRLLHAAGVEAISLSKYRVGIALLTNRETHRAFTVTAEG